MRNDESPQVREILDFTQARHFGTRFAARF